MVARFVFLSLFLLENALASVVSPGKSVSLEVSTVVDTFAAVEIDEEIKSIGVSDKSKAKLKVLYNGAKGVDVHVDSANDWKLKPSKNEAASSEVGKAPEIPYHCVYEEKKVEDGTIFLEASKFGDAHSCDVELSFEFDEKRPLVQPGKYSDTITISVVESQR